MYLSHFFNGIVPLTMKDEFLIYGMRKIYIVHVSVCLLINNQIQNGRTIFHTTHCLKLSIRVSKEKNLLMSREKQNGNESWFDLAPCEISPSALSASSSSTTQPNHVFFFISYFHTYHWLFIAVSSGSIGRTWLTF